MKEYKHYDTAFKLEVIKLIVEQGASVTQLLKMQSPQGNSLTPKQQRIRELERENRQLKSDSDQGNQQRVTITNSYSVSMA